MISLKRSIFINFKLQRSYITVKMRHTDMSIISTFCKSKIRNRPFSTCMTFGVHFKVQSFMFTWKKL